MPELTASDAKLIQYLNEAYGKEMELETSLQAHIGMTTRAPYRKRLQQHLKETRGHARQVERRIKKLGGKAEVVPAPGPDAVAEAASTVQSVASKAVAAAKGPLHLLRGTGEQEKMLKNAKTEYSEEAEEIAHYSAIETLAQAVGDRETAKLARGIRREEERMAKFLAGQIETLTKGVVQEEIPSSERAKPRRRRSGGSTRSKSSASTSRSARKSTSGSSARKSTSGSSARKSTARKSGGAKSGGGSRSSAGRKTSSRSGSSRTSSRSSSSRSGGSRSGGGGKSGSRSGGSRSAGSGTRSRKR